MKNVFFAFAFMLIGTFAFANKTISVETLPPGTSCTVTVQFGESTVTITNTCDCTQTAACDGAYAIARLATMLYKSNPFLLPCW
jgi:hypothetical protein